MEAIAGQPVNSDRTEIRELSESPQPERPSAGIHEAWRPLAIYSASRVWMLLALLALIGVHRSTTFSGALTTYDGGWYLRLAEHGYPHVIPMSGGRAVQSTLGFFPLFPLAVRYLHAAIGMSNLMSAEVVVTIFGATFAVALWWLMRRLFGDKAADRATALVCFFPGFFAFALIYSEPMSLTLSVICLLALVRRWWWVAGISAALATATRPNAVVLVACCAWTAAVAIRNRRDWMAVGAPVLAPVGLVIHFTFLYFQTGSFWAYVTSQEQGWGLSIRPSTPFHLVRVFVSHPFAHGDAVLQLLGSAIIVVTAVVLVRSHYPGVIVVYALGLGAIDLCTVPSPRFVLTAFPLVAVVGHRLRGIWYLLALIVSATALAGLLALTVLGKTTP